jgi:hypothetical protein
LKGTKKNSKLTHSPLHSEPIIDSRIIKLLPVSQMVTRGERALEMW